MRGSAFREMRLAPLAALLALAACTHGLRELQEPGRAVGVPTFFPSNSMVFAARTDSGVIVIDLGWAGGGDAVRWVLGRLNATEEDVTDVFLTHSHRDHVWGWKAVRGARFHLAAGEVPLFAGEARHPDVLSRAAEEVLGSRTPPPGTVDVRPFSRDTTFVFGGDTVRAFLVPGHTAGSAAYLFEDVLFTGDAVAYSYLTGFHGAERIFTADMQRARESVASLFERVRPYPVRLVCTAHAKCSRPSEHFFRKVLPKQQN
jgi:glyoxylase-like metal-dependent hydrolase (beta-lactamase superfamily II)